MEKTIRQKITFLRPFSSFSRPRSDGKRKTTQDKRTKVQKPLFQPFFGHPRSAREEKTGEANGEGETRRGEERRERKDK